MYDIIKLRAQYIQDHPSPSSNRPSCLRGLHNKPMAAALFQVLSSSDKKDERQPVDQVTSSSV